MTKSDPLLDHLFVYIGDHAFTLKQLGPAADMRFDEAFQYIIDQGLLGEELVGTPWFKVIKSSGISAEAYPEEDEELLFSLHSRWKAAERNCMELDHKGELKPEDTSAMMKLRREYEVAKKLSRP
jgi:hypothetical protein